MSEVPPGCGPHRKAASFGFRLLSLYYFHTGCPSNSVEPNHFSVEGKISADFYYQIYVPIMLPEGQAHYKCAYFKKYYIDYGKSCVNRVGHSICPYSGYPSCSLMMDTPLPEQENQTRKPTQDKGKSLCLVHCL